ncbi:uncharacterized protein LOC132928750 [Rhopalosiphum padi]|uniref:uncharacterized protein LOC132928750 n=1 Tax=Rhopalosiphum padi TaxID=40932 RepID=UPI00298E19ED|nr:uncharacterized protein LOC132928750 [Rhopalosiphum padi]
MIVSKHHLRLLVGVLVIYCCIESNVGSIRGVLHEIQSTTEASTSSDIPSDTTRVDTTMSDTTISPTDETVTPKSHRHRTIIWTRKTSGTTEEPSSTITEEGKTDRLYY